MKGLRMLKLRILLILSSMNSGNPTGPHSQAYFNRAKSTSIKYAKYCQHQGSKVAFMQCIDGTIGKINGALAWAWNLFLPRCIKGAQTPYQALLDCVPAASIKQLQNITLAKGSVEQAVQSSKMSLLVTYSESSLAETLSKLHNNQQINALINKKAEIFLIKLDNRKQEQVSEIQGKVRQFMESVGVEQNAGNQERVVVVWKGLFSQLIILSYFLLSDPQLCARIMASIQEREGYEELVVRLANEGQQTASQNDDKIYEQSSFNKLTAQTTTMDKDTNQD